MVAEAAEEAVFHPLHAAPAGGVEVIVAEEVQHAMDGVAQGFIGPGRAEAPGLAPGLVGADEQFSVKLESVGRGTVVEADDVGGAFVMEEGLVEAGHFVIADEMDAEGIGVEVEVVFEEMAEEGAEGGEGEEAGALAIAQEDLGAVRGVVGIGVGLGGGRRGVCRRGRKGGGPAGSGGAGARTWHGDHLRVSGPGL